MAIVKTQERTEVILSSHHANQLSNIQRQRRPTAWDLVPAGYRATSKSVLAGLVPPTRSDIVDKGEDC